MTDVYIFWEPQDAALCGLHAMNTLLQEPVFSAYDLADIARELDEKERNIMMEGGNMTAETLRFLSESSGNVDESGNFSIQVLRAAVKRSHGVDLISWTGDEGKQVVDVTKEHGFIINRSSHWFSIRRINNRFWNLNSTLEGGPEVISPFFLSAFLDGLRNDGYSVFIAKGGKLPAGGTKPFGASSTSSSTWFTEKELLARASPSMTKEKAPFSWDGMGTGRRLVDKSGGGSGGGTSEDADFLLAQALSASLNDVSGSTRPTGMDSGSNYGTQTSALRNHMDPMAAFDDPDLALAIALYKSENGDSSGNCGSSSSNQNGPLTKDQIRQKRLDAMNRK